MAALKCWLQEMLATEIGLASPRRRRRAAAALAEPERVVPRRADRDTARRRRAAHQGSGSGRFKCGDQRISLLGKHGDSSGRFELSL